MGKFLKPLETINLPKYLGNFIKVSKSIIFLVKYFLGNFCRHLAIFSGHTDSIGPREEHVPRRLFQVHRLMGATDKALQDLDLAIDLSRGQGRSACQAYCQRGTSTLYFYYERLLFTLKSYLLRAIRFN